MSELQLTAEQEAEALRWADLIAAKARQEALAVARLLASKKDSDILGNTEFDVRKHVHRIGAFAVETALNERKKGGTKGQARPVPSAATKRSS